MESPDFLEFLNLLNVNEVKYLVVGGYAVVAHGYRRFTGDLDIWFEPTEENAVMLLNALEAFGIGRSFYGIDDLLDSTALIQFGRYPYRVDLLNSIEGVTFEEAYPNRVYFQYGNRSIPFIGLQELLTNKSKISRKKDRLDVKNLTKKKKPPV